MKLFKHFHFCILFVFAFQMQVNTASAQSDSFVVVADVIFVGNDRTKTKVITREMTFSKGDTLLVSQIDSIMDKNEQLVMNTQLFVEVKIGLQNVNDRQSIAVVKVKERWYTFPAIIFELADRNFNEWWVQRDRDLNRVDYGIRFYQENVRGMNEQLKAVFQLGFTQKFELFYKVPFIDKEQKFGTRFGASYSQNRNVAYEVRDDFLIYDEDDDFQRQRFYAVLEVNKRTGFYQTQFLEAKFHSNSIADSISILNPNYYGNGRDQQRYFSLRYSYEMNRQDYKGYPTKGYYLFGSLIKTGLYAFDDIDLFQVEGKAAVYKPIGKKFILSSMLGGRYNIWGDQPFANENALGYGETFVSGYEYYAIYGQHYALNRNSLRFRLFDLKFDDLYFVPVKKFSTIPIAVYLKTYADQGYVWSFQNNRPLSLANEYLLGGGVGVDIVTYYDIVFRIEYSWNRISEEGFFLHFQKAF